jgi:hypothetical protein
VKSVLRRILSIFSIASLLVGVLVLVIWWRSYGHTDHVGFGDVSSRRTDYTSRDGRVMVTISQNTSGQIVRSSQFYADSRIAGWCLAIPAFWFAIWLRSKLPRPGRIPKDDYLPPLGSSRF